ncbi:MAG: glycosyltransferase [Deltaproteobacteria bacterium]|jgi:glycosyltransferase involved in cell wall biosynthesis|nr:glycosyltransferase [Deltaproteobacteria bacterium]
MPDLSPPDASGFVASLPDCDILMQLDNMLEGGLENVVIDLSLALERRGYRVAVLVLGDVGEGARKAVRRGLRVCVLPYDEAKLRLELERRPPRLVFAHYSFQAAHLYKALDIPFIQVLHNIYAWFSEADRTRFALAAEHTRLFVAVSEAVREYSIQALGVAAEKCLTIPNGIDLSGFTSEAGEGASRLRADLGFSAEDYVFVGMASVNRVKRISALVRAFCRLRDLAPEARLALAGYPYDTAYRDEILSYIEQNDLQERVRYLGHAAAPERLYLMADAFVHASAIEGGQLTLLEALAANLAVVTTDVGFARHFKACPGIRIVERRFSYAVPEAFTDPEALGPAPELVADLALAMLQSCRSRIRPNLPREILEAFASTRTYARYDQLVTELLDGRSPQSSAESWTDMLGRLPPAPADPRALLPEDVDSLLRLDTPLRLTRRRGPEVISLARKKAYSFAILLLKFALSLLPEKYSFYVKQKLKTCFVMFMGGKFFRVLRRKAVWNVKKFQKYLDTHDGRSRIIIESSMPWDHALFQRPQQLALALGRLGHSVIYKQYQFLDGAAKVADNVWVVDTAMIDGPHDAAHIFFSTYDYPESYFHRLSSGDIIIYDYIDHIDEKISGGIIARLRLNKEFMFRDADIVTASAKVLYDEAKASSAAEVVLLQNGVDAAHYFSFTRASSPPSRMAPFLSRHKKIVGYFGVLAPWLDYDLMNALIASRTDIGFVFIGPDYGNSLRRFARADNCLLLGAIDYMELPNYALWFDICWIPFEPGDIAKSTSPLKLFEYFALGKPVVVTSDMLECIRFPLVLHAHGSAAFSERIDEAIRIAEIPDTGEKMKQLAVENSWLARAGALSASIQKIAAARAK